MQITLHQQRGCARGCQPADILVVVIQSLRDRRFRPVSHHVGEFFHTHHQGGLHEARLDRQVCQPEGTRRGSLCRLHGDALDPAQAYVIGEQRAQVRLAREAGAQEIADIHRFGLKRGGFLPRCQDSPRSQRTQRELPVLARGNHADAGNDHIAHFSRSPYPGCRGSARRCRSRSRCAG